MLKKLLIKLMQVRRPHMTPGYRSDTVISKEPDAPASTVQKAVLQEAAASISPPQDINAMLWAEFEKLLLEAGKRRKWGLDELDGERRFWQSFFDNQTALNMLFDHLWVRLRSKKGLIQLYDSGRVVAQCGSTDELQTFHDMVGAGLRQRLERFIALPEREKTQLLLRNCGVKADFTKKQHSYIAGPDFLVLSEHLDFSSVNALLLESGVKHFWKAYLPCLLAANAGLSGFLPSERSWDGRYVPYYLQLVEKLQFLPFHLLLRKYVKRIALTTQPVMLYRNHYLTLTIQKSLPSETGRDYCLIRWQERHDSHYFQTRRSGRPGGQELVYNLTNSHFVSLQEIEKETR